MTVRREGHRVVSYAWALVCSALIIFWAGEAQLPKECVYLILLRTSGTCDNAVSGLLQEMLSVPLLNVFPQPVAPAA